MRFNLLLNVARSSAGRAGIRSARSTGDGKESMALVNAEEEVGRKRRSPSEKGLNHAVESPPPQRQPSDD